MQEIALVYGVVAWLAVWWLDLLFLMLTGPLILMLVLKFIITTVCLVVIVWSLARRRWLVAG
jgi:hypothetical protein